MTERDAEMARSMTFRAVAETEAFARHVRGDAMTDLSDAILAILDDAEDKDEDTIVTTRRLVALMAAPAPTIDALDVERLAALEAAATPGPWVADHPGFGTIFVGEAIDERGTWLFDPREGTSADAAFIAASRNALPALIAVARAAAAQPGYNKKALREPFAPVETEL